MKKIVMFSLLLGMMAFICTACDGDVTRALRHDGFSVGGDIVCEAFIGENATETVKYLTSKHIITTSGRIYELSLGQQYSSKSNCRVADTNLRVEAIMDDIIVRGSDGKYYYLTNQNNGGGSYLEVTEDDNNYVIYDILLKPTDTIKVVTVDSRSGTYYALKSDGNVYEITISKKDSGGTFEVSGTNIIYSQSDYGGAIKDFGYHGENGATYVRTATSVYRFRAVNIEECSKYADVTCDYQMVEAASFGEYGDYILAYNGSLLITTYGKTFTVAA